MSNKMRVLVCGGRNFTDREHLFNILDRFHATQGPIALIIHGAAAGADYLAMCWAQSRKIKQRPFAADWQRYGKAAGHRRNKQMLVEGNPDVVIAFSGGSGTVNMIKQAIEARVSVLEIADLT